LEKRFISIRKKKNYLLIPGINKIKDLNEAISTGCKIIKIFPVLKKDKTLDIKKYSKICFIGAGGISIKDLDKFISIGYKSVIIGNQGYHDGKFDNELFEWLNKGQKKIN
tara:strand:- start:1177 stop:1506 length:330 start_codon:yes stop_codon:yes gene_type:complete